MRKFIRKCKDNAYIPIKYRLPSDHQKPILTVYRKYFVDHFLKDLFKEVCEKNNIDVDINDIKVDWAELNFKVDDKILNVLIGEKDEKIN